MAHKDKTRQMTIWSKRLAAWERSGQSVAGYCRSKGLTAGSLYAWRRRLKAGEARPKGPKRAPGAARFVEVRVSPERAVWTCELELKNGRKLRFPGGVPAEQVVALASALEAAPC